MTIRIDGDIASVKALVEKISGSDIELPPAVKLMLEEATMKIDFKKNLGTGKVLNAEINITEPKED